MDSGRWIVNEIKEITIVTTKDVNLKLYYAESNSTQYNEIDGTFTKIGDRHFISHAFDTVGNYIIRIVDLNGNLKDIYASIDVVSLSSSDSSDILTSIENAMGDIADAATSLNEIVLTLEQNIINSIYDTQLGNWELKDNQMIMYKANGDILATFNLFDTSGKPSMRSVAKRVRV